MTTETVPDYNPYDPEVLRDPYPYYEQLRSHAPVYKSPLSSRFWMFTEGEEEHDVFIVTGYQELSIVLENSELFTSEEKQGVDPAPEVVEELATGYPITPTLYSLDPPEHTRRRHLFQRALSAGRVKDGETTIRAIADQVIDTFADDEEADLFQQYCTPFVQAALLEFVGVTPEDRPKISDWTQAFQAVCIPGSIPADMREAAREVVGYQRSFERGIGDRMTDPRPDLLGLLAEARADAQCPVTMGEMVWGLMELIGAGYGNTAESLANVLNVLLSEPARWHELQADRGLVGAAVEEALRLEGSVHWLSRSTRREVELGGVTLPEGSIVVCLFGAANRDPDAFPNPDVFDVRRGGTGPLGPHLATGRGVHYCVGGLWARTALRVGIEALLDRLPGLALQAGFEQTFITTAPMIRIVCALPVRWETLREI